MESEQPNVGPQRAAPKSLAQLKAIEEQRRQEMADYLLSVKQRTATAWANLAEKWGMK